MFKTIISGRNIELTKGIKDHVTSKLSKLDTHFDFIQEIHVFLSVEKNPKIKESHRAEATVHVNGAIVRVEVAKEDLYVAMDELVRKIDRSLTKHKTKLLRRAKTTHTNESIRRAGFEDEVAKAEVAAEDDLQEEVFLTFVEETEEATV